MWKRKQACFAELTAAGNGIWAEGEEAVFSRRAVQEQKGWPGEPHRPHSHTGGGSRYHGASQPAMASSPTGILSEGSPSPQFGLPGPPLVRFLGNEGGQQAGAAVHRPFCALLPWLFSLSWGSGRVGAARPSLVPTEARYCPNLMGTGTWSQRVWSGRVLRTGVAGVGQPWGRSWAPLGVATGQCREWVWVEAGYPRSKPGWSKRAMFTFQGVLNSLTVHPTQLLPQLPCPAGCTPAPPTSPSTMLTPLPFASVTPTQPAIPCSFPMEVRWRRGRTPAAGSAGGEYGTLVGVLCLGAWRVGMCGSRLLSQPPGERCSALSGWLWRHFLLPQSRWRQLLSSHYASSRA